MRTAAVMYHIALYSLFQALVEMSFRPGSFICEQGKPGNSFYIITQGTCSVAVHDPNTPSQQREVSYLAITIVLTAQLLVL
jgi:CRP-like cAMP-binding protein